jgi:membrane-bound inhibitor of C-type lysozyme
VRDTYSCSDKKTKITYDDAKSRAFLTYAAKRIVLTRQPAPNERHYVSAKYNLDWHVKGDTAVLASVDPKTGAVLSTLAECTLLKK